MATKTDRILGYLPRTFQKSPRPLVLYPVVNPFGQQLQTAENSLSAVMLSHWVDFADKGAVAIDDLAQMGALYGLAQRDDESVEEFRQHLKHYVRTFLDGTVTVQGILRITAEVLGLHIADADADLDSWWRNGIDLVTVTAQGDDAAQKIFGVAAAKVIGTPASAAQVVGTVSLDGASLPSPSALHLAVDGGTAVDVALPAGPINSDDMVSAINKAIGKTVASVSGSFLVLASPMPGASSRLELLAGPSDAAGQLLGLVPRDYVGSTAVGATLVGQADLSAGVDLSQKRFLRLSVDASRFAEIDCADPHAPSATGLDHICQAIDSGIGINVASHDGKHLALQSPGKGSRSGIVLQGATVQDARALLFGPVVPIQTGRDAAPARVVGTQDLSRGIDLSAASNIQLTIDGISRTVNCAGLNPKQTQMLDIVTAINAAFGAQVASPDGVAIALASRTAGPGGTITFGSAATADATEAIFGIGPRLFFGSDAKAARMAGTPDLNLPSPPAKRSGVDLAAQHLLQLAVDGGPTQTIDLRSAAGDVRAVMPAQLVDAINQATAATIASTDGNHLILTSPTSGAGSSLEIKPLERGRHRRFVTRARVIDEAAQLVFGAVAAQAQGTPATTAEIVGTADLSHGIDLRDASTLRITVDELAPQEIDCAGARPRATQLQDVVNAINSMLPNVASSDKRHLILSAPSIGTQSRIVIEPPTGPAASDALPRLGFVPTNVRGADATRVSFTSLADLSAGLDLVANAAISLNLNGEVHEINLASGGAAHRSATEIASLINVTFKAVVCIVAGPRLVLTSLVQGVKSQIGFNKPTGPDATKQVFGVSPGRLYTGQESEAARLESSQADLSKTVDLSVGRILRLSVNGGASKDVDCAALAANPSQSTLTEIVNSINAINLPNQSSLVFAKASTDGKHLVLTSPTSGFGSALQAQTIPAGDASQKLLGTLDPTAQGQDPGPATITGTVSVTGSVDLSQRDLLRLSVNGGRSIDINVAGLLPSATTLDEVVAAINQVFPQAASITPDDKLQLTAPSGSNESSIALLPLRYLEVVEYPPVEVQKDLGSLHAGDRFELNNSGAAATQIAFCVTVASGVVDPTFVNLTTGASVGLHTSLQAGDTACVSSQEDSGLGAQITSADGTRRALPLEQIRAGSQSYSVVVPFDGPRRLARDSSGRASLQLDNSSAPSVVILRPRRELAGSTILVSVTPADPSTSPSPFLFDVEVSLADGTTPAEIYQGVTIGEGPGEGSLTWQINVGATFKSFSQLVKAEEMSKSDALLLPTGESQWIYTECDGPRYDEARFYNSGGSGVSAGTDIPYRYPGKFCEQVGVFNLSRYGQESADAASPLYGPFPSPASSPVTITAHWMSYQPGSFAVNLPVDLDERFGARFNQSFYASKADPAESYAGVVAEPDTDTNTLVNRLTAKPSAFVTAQTVSGVPLGWTAAKMPFRRPQFLTRNPGVDQARLYLTEEGLDGAIELTALQPGAWGDHVSVSARLSGPAIYDVDIFFKGARYENARQVVRGPLPALGANAADPGPVGVLQAKAAGVLADVTRDRSPTRDAQTKP